MGDPIPGPLDILRTWYELPRKKGRERAEDIARLEEFLRKAKSARPVAQRKR